MAIRLLVVCKERNSQSARAREWAARTRNCQVSREATVSACTARHALRPAAVQNAAHHDAGVSVKRVRALKRDAPGRCREGTPCNQRSSWAGCDSGSATGTKLFLQGIRLHRGGNLHANDTQERASHEHEGMAAAPPRGVSCPSYASSGFIAGNSSTSLMLMVSAGPERARAGIIMHCSQVAAQCIRHSRWSNAHL